MYNTLNPAYAPITILAQEVFIQDSVFSFVSPYQFEFWDSTGFWSGIITDRTSDAQVVSLINNRFEINDENVLRKYQILISSIGCASLCDRFA